MRVKSSARRSVCVLHAALSSSPSVNPLFACRKAATGSPAAAFLFSGRARGILRHPAPIRWCAGPIGERPPMRFRLLRRRLTISAPRMSVRSAMPWPVRWLVLAVVFGFCAAVALWAFEFGRSIAGLDAVSREELQRLHSEVDRLREENLQRQAVANTSGSMLVAERTALEQLTARLRQAEAENRALREDLGFFEKLIPANAGGGSIAIRGLQAELLADTHLRWQVLLMRPVKNAPEFKGRLELVVAGTRDGKSWSQTLSGEGQALQLRQYRRMEGVVDLPLRTVVKTITARVLEGAVVHASQTAVLDREEAVQ